MEKPMKHLVLILATIIVTSCGLTGTIPATATTHAANTAAPPNFVVIFTDDQGYGDVGCFGSPDIRTPRLDTMATQGMKFTGFYAQPVCGPSRAALMTGCYPMRVAERGNTKQVHPILHSNEITVAEVLKAKGYATACFGKWGLGKTRSERVLHGPAANASGFRLFLRNTDQQRQRGQPVP